VERKKVDFETVLAIRCKNKETKTRFKMLSAELGKNYEDTLNFLMDYYLGKEGKKPVKRISVV